MIIGVTGYLGAGKDTVGDYLVKKGFQHISLSDILREDLRKNKKEVTRKNLQDLGSNLRTLASPGLLAERALSRFIPGKKYVVSSIGTLGEVAELRKNPKFVLVFVDAPQKTRYERIIMRKRGDDQNLTFQQFKKDEVKESKGGGKAFREFDRIKSKADIIINNDSGLKVIYKKIDKMLLNLKKRPSFERPSWDAYFMGIMEAISERATCDRGKSGSLIVKDKRILTTGYVGSPIGIEHCYDSGHLFHKVLNQDGTTSNHCVRTIHAEQNAIVQAARYGTSINGATMYCKMEPCRVCAMLIINAGIKRVVALKRYHRAQDTRQMFKQAGVKLDVIEQEIETYANM